MRKYIALAVAALLALALLTAVAEDQAVYLEALQVSLDTSREVINQLLEKVKAGDPKAKQMDDEDTFLLMTSVPDTAHQWLLYGLFDSQDRLIVFKNVHAAVPVSDADTYFNSQFDAMFAAHGAPYRELGGTSFRETAEEDEKEALRLVSWKTTTQGQPSFVHLMQTKTINAANQSVTLLITYEDLVLPTADTAEAPAKQNKSVTGPAQLLPRFEDQIGDFFAHEKLATVAASMLMMEAYFIDTDWQEGKLEQTSDDDAAYLVRHEYGISLYWFSQDAGLIEVIYYTGDDSIELLYFGYYANSELIMTTFKEKDLILQYIEVSPLEVMTLTLEAIKSR